MKISDRNFFFRVAKACNADKDPKNFCEMFWINVVMLVGPIVAVAEVIIIILQVGWWALLILPAVILIAFILIRFTGDSAQDHDDESVKSGIIAVIKNKYCPRLEVIRESQKVGA